MVRLLDLFSGDDEVEIIDLRGGTSMSECANHGNAVLRWPYWTRLIDRRPYGVCAWCGQPFPLGKEVPKHRRLFRGNDGDQ
jgi:hypothetical protein